MVVVEEEGPAEVDPQRTSASLTLVEVGAQLSASADVAQVLESVPGTRVVTFGGLGDWSAVSIRGSTLRQVQVYLDGIPLNPDGADTVNLGELPLFAFKRVEVWRGTGPPVMDAAPVGGVVNLVSADELPTTAMASSGSWGTHRMHATHGGHTTLFGAPLSGTLVAELFHTQGDFLHFSDNSTEWTILDDAVTSRANNDKTQASVHGRLRLAARRAKLTWLESYLRREEGLPGPATAPTTAVSMETGRHLSVLQGEVREGVWKGEGRLWRTDRTESWADPLGEWGSGPQARAGHTSRTGLVLSAKGAPTSWLLPSATFSTRQDRYRAWDLRANEADSPRVRRSVSAIAAADLWTLGDRLRLSPAVQGAFLDNEYLDSDAEDARLFRLNPRVGALGVLGSTWVLKANAGKSLRPPDFTELFGQGGAVIGNPDLKPERATSWDVGIRGQFSRESEYRAALEATWFSAETEDLIVWVQNAQRASAPMNFGLSAVHGLEVGFDLSLLQWLHSRSALTLTRSRNLSEDPAVAGKQLPRQPGMELWQSTSYSWGSGWSAGHTWSYTRGNFWDATNWYAAAPRGLHGAYLRALPAPGWPTVEVSVLNLGNSIAEVIDRDPLNPDEGRRVAAITDFVGYPLPGRTWMFTLRWRAHAP